jgi:hypothetical protein
MTALAIILFGVACVGAARWLIPREAVRIRTRRARSGRPTERFDELLRSSLYRASLAWIATLGVLAVVFGVVLALE